MLNWQETEDRNKIHDILIRDGIVLCSTDTVYGLLTQLTEAAEQKLHALKGARSGKHFLVLIAGIHKLGYFAELPDNLTSFLNKVWPGPVTCVVKTIDGTIALRAPKHDGLLELLKHFDGLYSTSANRAGADVPHSEQDIDPVLMASADAFIDSHHQLDKVPPSTILDCTDLNDIRLIREGAFPLEKLEELYGTTIRRD